jgi:hypothetical protein
MLTGAAGALTQSRRLRGERRFRLTKEIAKAQLRLRMFLHQGSDQAQQGLMLWPVAAVREEVSNFHGGRLSAGRGVRLMLDENPLGRGLPDETPPITMWRAAIKLSALKRHGFLLRWIDVRSQPA